MQTLSQILKSKKGNSGITFINKNEEFLSYQELYNNSLKLLNYFNYKGLQPNSKLIFQLNSNQNFVNSFWASILGGVVAVPVSVGNNDEHRLKLLNIYSLLDDAFLIVDSNILDKLEIFAKKNDLEEKFLEIKAKTIDIRDIDFKNLEMATSIDTQKDDLALIQFSSGSTGEPKGVMLTHNNIIHNAKGFLESANITKDDSYLSWFPLTHDMGLMGWHINPLILGANQVLIETNVFIRRPLLWLDSATKFKSTVLCSPNFGYRYLLKFLKKEQNWDLRNIRLIFNGAEPISASLCDDFLESLEPYGLKKESMYTVYGLAEATLAVAFPKPSEMFRRYYLDINHLNIGQRVRELKTDVGSVTYVDVGYPLVNMQIRITADNSVLSEDFIGHIEIKSVSVTEGYYNNQEETERVLKADGWLDTGDLGFIRDGRLIITGRAKDIIIKNGVNYYPHDIEEICCQVEACELNKVVAIGSRDKNQEDEELILFVLFKKELKEFFSIQSEIKKVILNKIGLEVSKVIPIKTIYKTTSGKLQRYKLLQKYKQGEFNRIVAELKELHHFRTNSIEGVLDVLIKEAEEILGERVESDKPLLEQGFSSIKLEVFKKRVSAKLDLNIDITTIFDYPTLLELSNHIINRDENKTENILEIDDEIAIVSVACRFPDASNPEKFFDNLLGGVDSVKSSSRWEKEYHGGFLESEAVTDFDNQFFNISPAESSTLDPQERILLETTLSLLERGAVDWQKEKKIAVFMGVSANDNLRLSMGRELTPYTLTSNLSSTLSGRIAYFFDFKAPALSIDTACSSSLVAIHQAIQAIRNGDCKMAIAGGVNVILDTQTFEGLSKMEALSKSGKCKTFDSDADGYVRGEGCGLLLLKPLKDALRDRDEVLSIIKSSSLNHDGKSNGLTAPNGLSQQALLKDAYRDIEHVDFIETHGTGTKLGDPIEVHALASVFDKQKIYLGAVKSNIGHLESGAGVAGVIKTVLAIKYKKLPANLHLETKNPYINWESISLEPVTKNIEWITDKPKIAGVSSFGFSGTNAHIVLEEFQKSSKTVNDKRYKLLLVSAKTSEALDELSDRYLEHITKDNLKDFLYSSSQKYRYSKKMVIMGEDIESLQSKKSIFISKEKKEEKTKTIFVFTGQGSQYLGMGRELFDNEPLFKKYFLECDTVFNSYVDKSLVDVIYGEDRDLLNEPIYTQASIFAIEYALAKYLMALGVKPDGVTGHSLGEYVASVIAEILTLEDAIRLVIVRSKLVSTTNQDGAMYAFMTSEDKIFDKINRYYDKLSIASINSKNNIVVSGDKETLESVTSELKEQGIRSIKLNINQAYHSVLLDSILFDFYYEADKITYKKPKIPFISAMKAVQVEELDANYFTTHLRNSVRFMDTVSYLNNQKFNLFIEIGADAHLTSLLMQQSRDAVVTPTLRKNRPQSFYETLANLYINGIDIDWNSFYVGYGEKIAIPTHPMNRDRFEIDYLNNDSKPLIKRVVPQQKRATINSLEKLKEFIYQVSGVKDIDIEMNLFELGLDSLSLFQLRENIKKEFALEIEMKEFYLNLNNIDKLNRYIDKNIEPIEIEVLEETEHTDIGEFTNAQLMKEQLDSINNLTQLFSKQLDTFNQKVTVNNKQDVSEELIKNASLKMVKTDLDNLNQEQQDFLDNFIEKYSLKYSKSKQFTINNKNQIADWINTVIYRQSLKEIGYPIVATDANGANFRDKDGNSFIDISMGYGSVFLGHNHPQIKEAMQGILNSGFVLSPQTELVEEVATLIRDFTKTQRVVFSNTGTEAVMAVLRAVRAVSKKQKIIKFQGSFHGTSDVILNTGDENGAYPTSRGINPSVADGVVEFQYGSPKIFDYIKENHQEIAGVLVEPVQSRRPDYQPKEFLEKLREVTKEFDIALIFDEMITGFRCARGGASEIFGVTPNISTFGKVVGGTMPIGIIAGDAQYLDVFDGGEWEFGDNSYPQTEMITFGGTFCKHPLTLSASLATLKVLRDNPNIQQEVNEKTNYLAKNLNRFFKDNNYPIKLNHFGSLFRFDFYGEYSATLNPIEIDMFFYMLIYKGVYTWEKRVCFLSASHTQDNLDFIIDKVKETLIELKESGLFSKIKSNSMEATSFQKRLYILSQFENSESIYNMYLAWETSKLDIEKVQKVFQKIVEMHPSLRTNLSMENEKVYQKINSFEFKIDILESDKNSEEKISDYINEKFDLEKDLLFKVLIVKQKSNFIIVIKTHHTIFDGPSIDIVMENFYKLYNNQTVDTPIKDYFDFTTEYTKLLGSEKLKKQGDFWLNRFNQNPSLNLPIDKPYPSSRTFNGEIEYFEIDTLLTQKIRETAKGYNVSINMLLYSCFVILLHKLTSQDNIVVGVPVTIRDNKFRDVVGMFANTVAIRQEIDLELTLSSYMKEIQKLFLEMLDNIEYPFEELVEKLELKKDLARNALFDVMFVYEDGTKRVFDEFKSYEIEKKFTNFDLTLEVIDKGDNLSCSFEYYQDIFNHSTIKRYISYFITILDELKEDKKLKYIDMLPQSEKSILESFNQTHKSYPKDKTIIELFEEQVVKNPNNIAIVYEDRELTYKELNQKANQLANYLIESGVKVEDIVAIKIERSLEMLIALWGILKAGCAYLPIDPEYPKERIAYILEDSKAKTVVTIETFKDIDNYSTDNPNIKMNSDNLAYVIYTSGSTGKPKGVMLTHKNVVSFSLNIRERFNLQQRETIYAITTIAFDISVLELISSLLYNLKVVISSNSIIEDNLKEIADNSIDIIQTTPSRYKAFLDLDKNALKGVKKLLIGGENLNRDVLKRLKALDCELYNVYGPTEATVWSTVKRVDNAKLDIGKPLFNESAYILDKTLNQLPLGAIGELYIAGDGLARGYLNREKLTNEVFINHPKLGRIYKTGDIAKYQEDGNIEYLGRIDDQVKIRGFRVELGEIENSILESPSIKESVVVAHNQNLVAYIVGEQKELKRYLQEKLPNYMIPSFVIELEKFPLTPNGKIDKKALPKPTEIESRKVYKEPKTKIQKEIADIFIEVLKLEKVSIDNNFFEIGGHSLNAISTIAKIAKSLEVDIKLKELFIYPTVEGLSKLIESKSKIEYLDIEPIEEQSSYEVSNSQRRLWVLDKMQNGSSVYNMSGAIDFEDALDKKILEKSLKILIDRHEILRTNFKEVDGVVRQIVHKNYTSRVKSIEIEDNEIDNYLEKEANRIFDLENGSLLYLQLINKNILFVNMHHIISDGWSIGIITKELSEIYTALVNGNEVNLKPLTVQYKDYTYWQNALLENKNYLKENQNYWHTLLKNLTPLEFPLDNPRGATQTFDGNNIRFKLSRERSDKLNMLAQDNTLFITILTIMNILISKYSNQNDIVLGTPTANRNHENLLNQIGFYVNSLALRNKLNPSATFKETLLETKESTINAFEHQSYPFDKLVDELNLDRDLTQNPIFNMMIILQNNEISELNFDNLKAKDRVVESRVSKFDMTFNFVEINSEVELLIEYNTNLFASSTIKRLFENLERLIDSIELDKKLNQLEFISTKEQTLLKSFNSVKREYPKDKTIIELFEEEVEKSPNNIAVIYHDIELTYQELNRRANQVGAYLLESYDIEPNSVIPIILEKSERMIISLLGVLKSGGAYLPIDSSYPKDRVAYMLKDSKAKILLTDRANLDKIDSYCIDLEIEVVCVEDIENFEIDNLNSIRNSRDLAYVIYTSGTTGQPKGVMVEHRSFINMILYQIESFNIEPKDNIIQFASFSFDASVYETFLTLLAGASYVIVDKSELLDNFVEITKKYSVNTAVLNPTFLANIEELENFKTIITAGEKAIPKDAIKYAKKCNYINAYGPTEVSICSAFYKVDSDKDYTSIPIGKTIANISNYILNDNLEQMPIGAIGEICTGGIGVTRGYLDREDLTNEKFINHPKLGRIYRTGDIAKYQEDGNIEYLGRVDDQVKIRGFRIELGEIENSILAYSFIKECMVIAKNQQLIAYIVGEPKELKTYLKEKLPNYMIPSYFIEMEKLPLTSNGKIDKKALPNPTEIERTKVYKEPKTKTQKEITEIFSEVLKLEKVSIDDNFFEIGGDSLNAISMVSKLAKLGYAISLKDIFTASTIEELSKDIKRGSTNIQNITIPDTSDREYHNLSYGEKGLYLLSVMNEDMTSYNEMSGFVFSGELNIEALKSSFISLVKKHEILRTAFVMIDGEPKQKILDEIEIDFDVKDIYKENLEEEIKELNAYHFNLSKTPLFKIKILTLSPTEHIIVGVMHHILSDGWSMNIILKEIETFYNAYVNHKNIELKPLKYQYRDFVAYEKELLEKIDNQRDYWIDRFDGYINKLELPTDYERSSKSSFDGDFIRVHFNKTHSNIFREIAKRQKQTLFSIFVSAIDILLYLYSKDETIVIGTPISNARKDSRFQNQIGYFLNTLAIKSTINPEKSFLDNFKSISEDIYDGFENSDYPFDKLIENLNLSNTKSKNPLFSVMVVLQSFDDINLEFQNLDIKKLDKINFGSKFDLKFEFDDKEEIELIIEYSTELFKKETIEKMRDNLIKLLNLVSKDINISLDVLDRELNLNLAVEIDQDIDEDF